MEFGPDCLQSLVTEEAPWGASMNNQERPAYRSGTDRQFLVDAGNAERLAGKHPGDHLHLVNEEFATWAGVFGHIPSHAFREESKVPSFVPHSIALSCSQLLQASERD
jgi:hypothetical protein